MLLGLHRLVCLSFVLLLKKKDCTFFKLEINDLSKPWAEDVKDFEHQLSKKIYNIQKG